MVGYSVRLAGPSEDRARTVWYGGGRLARDLTLPALRRGWGQEHGEQQRAVDEWSSDERRWSALGGRAPGGARRSGAWCGIAARWRSSGCGCGLRAAGTDPGACAHAAREGAAVLAAWSIDLEGEQPGPLARASRQLARSAELSAYDAGAAERPPSRASGLALFMLAAGRPDSAVGWLLVCRELGLLAGEIGRVHRARGELAARASRSRPTCTASLSRSARGSTPTGPTPARSSSTPRREAARRAREPLGPATREAP